jgi:hypothetical protein
MVSPACNLAIVSDIHYAGPAEQARGKDFEVREVRNALVRCALKAHRRWVWMRDPMGQNHLLDRFIERVGSVDFVVANGDFSCNSAAIGLGDDAAFESATLCLGKLRAAFGGKLLATYGDHELGKVSLAGGRGGMRLASWQRAQQGLELAPFWQVPIGNYVLMGVASSLVALPVFLSDTRPEERHEWERLRAEHMEEVRRAFLNLRPAQKVLLFCHDPSALPFLWRAEAVRTRLDQIEQTIIGHLHSNLVLWNSRLLAGMPVITFMGHAAKRFSTALNEARHWRPFKVRLCPALGGIELLKDGGWLTVELDPEAASPPQFQFHPLPRKRSEEG